MTIVFQVEAADRSVGIMSEGFMAWRSGGPEYCNMTHYDRTWAASRFEWTTNDGTVIRQPPPLHQFVERALHAYAEAFYATEV
jgi:hypothetical protein